MSVTGVYLEEVYVLTRTGVEVKPHRIDEAFMNVNIKGGSFQFTDKHVLKILKEFEKDEIQEIFKKLKEDGYV